MRFAHPFDFPVGAVVQHRQTLFAPAPFADQLAEDLAPPADAGLGQRQLFTHFQVETAAGQIEAGGVVDVGQVAGDALEHHAVGVEPEADDLALMQAMFDVRRQQLGIGIFPGIGFQQQGLQHRLVRRIDALVQLPQAGAEVLFRRQRTQAAEIQPLVRRQRALRVQRQHVFIVVRFFFARHHVPQDALAGQAHRGAVEFVEQQDMLRRAAVFAAQAAAFIMAEAVFVDQEEADFHPHRGGPLLKQAAFLLQAGAFFVVQPGLVADPDVEIRAAALADRRGAAHRIDAGDRQLAAGRFVKRAAPFVF